MLVAVGKRRWQIYIAFCDQKNNLAKTLDEYQTH